MKRIFLLMAMAAGLFMAGAQVAPSSTSGAGGYRDCDITTLPYFENFDGIPEESYPSCWTKPNPFQGYPMTEGGYAHSGSYSLKFKCNYSTVEPLYAVMPHINANFNDLRLTFWTRPEASWSHIFQVGYMTSSTDTSTFVALQTYTGSTFGSSYQQQVISFSDVATNPNNDYYIAFKYKDNGNNWYWFIDDIQVDLVASCVAPDSLATGQVTGTSATLFWNGENSFYTVYYKEDGDTTWTSVSSVSIDTNGYLLDYLNPNTTYQWYVAAECSDGTLANSPSIASFTTPCAVYPAPFIETFDSTSHRPDCWEHYKGLASDIFGGAAFTTPSSYSGWAFDNTNVFGARHASLNIYGMNCSYWLVTPEIDLSTLNAPTLTFNLALTDYNNANPIENPIGQLDDKFMVLISTDGGSTWSASNATVWSNDSTADFSFNQIATEGEEISLSLAAYAGQTVTIAFYGESTSAPGDNDLHIDNVTVDEMSACPKPTQLTASNITATSADLSWTENGTSTSWIVEYGTEGFTPGNGTILNVANTPSAHLDNLQSNTLYDVYVISDCGSGSLSNAATMSFSTGLVAAELPYSTDFSQNADQEWMLHNGGCANQWVIGTISGSGSALFVTNNGNTPGYNVESTSVVCAEKTFTVGTDDVIISFDVQVGGESDYDFLKVYFAPADAEFPASTSGNVPFADYAYSTNAFNFSEYMSLTEQEDNPYTFCLTGGNTVHIDAEMPNPNPNATSSSTAKLVFVWVNDFLMGTQPAAVISNVSVSTLTCPKPTVLTVSNITQSTADLSWSAGGDETVWNLEYRTESESNWTVIPVYSTNYTLTGLTDSTTYLVRVQADCGNGEVSTYATLTFTTDSTSTPVFTEPTVSTGSVSNVTQTTATLHATITNPDNVTITERGFELSTVSTGNVATFTVAGSGNTYSSDLTNLTAETDYSFRAFITFNGNTVYGNEMTFTTEAEPSDTVGIADRLAGSVTLYPNPAREVVNVQCTMDNGQLCGELYLFDVYGKLLQIVPVTSEITSINVSGLANGLYFVRVTTKEGMVTKTFVKKG